MNRAKKKPCTFDNVWSGGPREVRQDERDDRERHDQSEIGRRPLQIVVLLMVPETAEQQRQADHPVQDDHQQGEHGIPPSVGAARGEHHRGDERDLDRDDRERQDQRAQRLAEQFGKVFSPLDHAEGAPRDDRDQPEEQPRRPDCRAEADSQSSPYEERDHGAPAITSRATSSAFSLIVVPAGQHYDRIQAGIGATRLPVVSRRSRVDQGSQHHRSGRRSNCDATRRPAGVAISRRRPSRLAGLTPGEGMHVMLRFAWGGATADITTCSFAFPSADFKGRLRPVS